MPHAARNKLIIKNLPKQTRHCTGRRRFGRGETVFLATEIDGERPTEHVGKIADVDQSTGMPYVKRYDDSGDTFMTDDLHKLILAEEREELSTPNVQITRYVHEICSWDNAASQLGAPQGHLITHRFVEHHQGRARRVDFYVVEIMYGGALRYRVPGPPHP